MQRGAYSRVFGASTAKRPAALGYAGAGPAQRVTGAQSVRAARRQDPLLPHSFLFAGVSGIMRFMVERTLAIIKPDAVRRHLVGAIIQRYEQAGLIPVAVKMVRLTKAQA